MIFSEREKICVRSITKNSDPSTKFFMKSTIFPLSFPTENSNSLRLFGETFASGMHQKDVRNCNSVKRSSEEMNGKVSLMRTQISLFQRAG